MVTRAYRILDTAIGDVVLPLFYSDAAPTNGTSGTFAGVAIPGALLISGTTAALYQNTGTLLSPTWGSPPESSVAITGGTINGTAIGGTTPAAGAFTSLSASASVALPNAAGITAHSTGGKPSATPLNYGISQLSVVAGDKDSVLLPPAIAGTFCVVTNNGANGGAIYSSGTDTINGASSGALYYLPVGQTVVMWCATSSPAGTWNAVIATAGATSQAQPSNPTAPSSTSAFQMQGLAGSFTPKKSGNALIIISGNFISSSTTAGDGAKIQLSYGTGVAPGNNTTLAGTQVGSIPEYTNPATVTAADVNQPFSTQAIVTGLTIDTPYWIDLAAEAVGTASHVGVANVSISVAEL